MPAVRRPEPHRGDSQQKVAEICRSEGGFAEKRRSEEPESSPRRFPANEHLTAAIPSKPVPASNAKARAAGAFVSQEMYPVATVRTFGTTSAPTVSTNGPLVDTVGWFADRFVRTVPTVSTFAAGNVAQRPSASTFVAGNVAQRPTVSTFAAGNHVYLCRTHLST